MWDAINLTTLMEIGSNKKCARPRCENPSIDDSSFCDNHQYSPPSFEEGIRVCAYPRCFNLNVEDSSFCEFHVYSPSDVE